MHLGCRLPRRERVSAPPFLPILRFACMGLIRFGLSETIGIMEHLCLLQPLFASLGGNLSPRFGLCSVRGKSLVENVIVGWWWFTVCDFRFAITLFLNRKT